MILRFLPNFRTNLILLIAVSAFSHPLSAQKLPETVDFNFDIKPILSDRCFLCHGPDRLQRKAELRLDTKQGLFKSIDEDEGMHVVMAKSLQKSELYRRITSKDDDTRMPPVDSGLRLTDFEKRLIKKWIEQGAKWNKHWSFIPLKPVRVPRLKNERWVQNEIDRFILQRLKKEGIAPSKQATKEKLIRRLSFDLTGLPPTLEEIDNYLADHSPQAYEKVVDRLINSPRYGERMAVDWLDVARYADTYGYQADVYRAVWPWRDWVVRAFNENLPYDKFITWQIAGDLLPNATRDQKLATSFNRQHRQTNEGGSIEKEYRAEYVSDRVNTFGAAFLGITIGCAHCHEHKYDPISHREYYQLFAFFNNIDESGLYSHFTRSIPTPTLLLSTKDQDKAIRTVEQKISLSELEVANLNSLQKKAFQSWLEKRPQKPNMTNCIGDYSFEAIIKNRVKNNVDEKKPGNVSENPQIVEGKFGHGLKLSGENNVSFTTGGNFTRNQAFSISLWMNTPDIKKRAVIFHRSRAWTDAGSRGYQILIEDGKLSASLIHFWPGNAMRIRTKSVLSPGVWHHVAMTYDGSSHASGLKLFLDGVPAECDVVRDKLKKNVTGGGANTLTIGQRFRDRGFKNGLVDEFKIYTRNLSSLEVLHLYDGKSLSELLKKPLKKLSEKDRSLLLSYYLSNFDKRYRKKITSLKNLRSQRSKLVDPIPEIMVMKEMSKIRPAHRLKRGAYDAPAEKVERGTPKNIFPMPENLPRNRLGLAEWLTLPQQPLTARVTVNRFWQSIFGKGLVSTPEDFGSQGEIPTHPQLLDWLANSFIDSGWDVKALLKKMVMSATYRQSSHGSSSSREKDPQNRLLSRGRRYRLSAEMIRDQALYTSGLLVEKMGGPPVKPYQPAGLWKEKSGGTFRRNKGEGSHRRSLYTYWKRTSPPPAMMLFDTTKRDVCMVKRQKTATPLQALVLLNDPQYVEGARALAEKAMKQNKKNLSQQIVFVFRTLTSRRPGEKELTLLHELYDEQLIEFQKDSKATAKFLKIGDHRSDSKLPIDRLAAMTVLVQAMLNFDETVTKR